MYAICFREIVCNVYFFCVIWRISLFSEIIFKYFCSFVLFGAEPDVFISYTWYNLNTSDENFTIFRQSFKLRTLVPCETELMLTLFRSIWKGSPTQTKRCTYCSVFMKDCISHAVVMTLQQRSSLNALIDRKSTDGGQHIC